MMPVVPIPPKAEEQNTEIVLKPFSALVPLLSVMIIILGITKQLLFYYNFNLPIKYFLGLSELGLIISDNLLFILAVFTIVATLFSISVVHAKRKWLKKQKELFNKIALEMNYTKESTPELKEAVMTRVANEWKAEWIKPESNKKLTVTVLWGITVCIILLLIMIILSHDYYHKVVGMSQMPILIFLLFYFANRKQFFSLITTSATTQLFVIFILLVSCVIRITAYEIRNTEHGKYNNTKIYTADTCYTSTDSSYFIGKTEKYVFIYNKFDTSTLVIPTESVIKMVLCEGLKLKALTKIKYNAVPKDTSRTRVQPSDSSLRELSR